MLRYILIGFISFISVSSQAAIINTSQNTGVADTAVAYIGDIFPTPHQDPNDFAFSLPSPQSIFSSTDAVRIAESISLYDLDRATDDNGQTVWNINALIWSIDWYNPDGALANNNFVSVNWSDIELWQTMPNLPQLTFASDTFQPLQVGTWTAYTFFDAVHNSTVVFDVVSVPAPATLLLMVPILLILLARRFKS
jgi:hypothetical protein